MKSFTFFPLMTLVLIALYASNLHSQPSQLLTANIVFESPNSLTFDLYVKNTGSSSWTYSHGSFAWTYNPSFLNGGDPSFSLVPGTSDFPSGGQPPSALLSTPSILRTSSNLPGSNGLILPGQTLRISRFRLQTSAASFSGELFNALWKTSSTPYTRVFTWDSGTGLPIETLDLSFVNESIILEENFDYGIIANPELINVTSNWVRHSGAQGPAYTTSSLSYPSYLSSGIGGSVSFTNGGSGLNDGDVNRVLPTIISSDNNVYASFLLNLSSGLSADYFFHLGPSSIGTIFRARLFARANSTGWSLGLSKSTEARTDDNTILNFSQTYLVVVKYTYSTVGTTDDVVTVYLYESGYPVSEPGSPVVTIGPIGAGLAGDLANVGTVAVRQGTNTPTGTIDGIRIGTNWSEIFPASGTPILSVLPSNLLGFEYFAGGGPSPSQSYNLSGTDLSPLSGNISVTGTLNYEISSDNVTFGSSLNIPYVGGVLAGTPIYVRLKAGLPAGIYNGEQIGHEGGGASLTYVTCNGAVTKPEPTNHVTNFAGNQGIPAYATIELNWTDAIGTTIPDGYLIKGSTINLDTISAPVDGVPVNNAFLVFNVNAGVQTHQFTLLNGGRNYYFKIFPYTNSGSLINYKTNDPVPQFSIATAVPPALPIIETFNYAAGSLLTDNGWLAHSGAGTNSIIVSPEPLLYTGYPLSGTGKSVNLVTSGEDVNRAFDSIKTGSVYASFLANVVSAQAGDYIFHFGLENNTSLFFGKVFVKDSLGSIGFGIAKNQNTAVVYTPCIYSLNTTYLIVVKYSFNNGTTTDDEARIWINPVLNGIEPAANIIHTDAGTDAPALGMFALRQGTAGSAAVVNISGIRIADSWIPSATGITLNLTAYIEGFWNGTTMINDNVTVELRNSTSPFSLVEQQTISLNNAGTGSALFNIAANGVPYYIVVKHRNSIETWSALPQQFISGTMAYDFSAAAAQAFGSNLKLKNTKWCLYSGDVNQDGVIDLQDMAAVDNSIGTANLPADVNGDGTVTSEDMNITFTNAQTFSSIKKPLNTPEAKIKTETSKSSID